MFELASRKTKKSSKSSRLISRTSGMFCSINHCSSSLDAERNVGTKAGGEEEKGGRGNLGQTRKRRQEIQVVIRPPWCCFSRHNRPLEVRCSQSNPKLSGNHPLWFGEYLQHRSGNIPQAVFVMKKESAAGAHGVWRMASLGPTTCRVRQTQTNITLNRVAQLLTELSTSCPANGLIGAVGGSQLLEYVF